jgi:hypothetical protein
MSNLSLSSSTEARLEDINWCTEVISTLGTVNSLREHFFVKAQVCQLLMQCSTLSADTTNWLNQHITDPVLREPLNPDPTERSPAQRNLLIQFDNDVLRPALGLLFQGLNDTERQRRVARLQLYGCWTPGTTHDEIIEALFHGYLYIMANVYGAILNSSKRVDADKLFNVCSDILFPHSDPGVLRASQFAVNPLADADTQLAGELSVRYLNITRQQRTSVLFTTDQATLTRHFTRMIKYARQFSQFQPHTSQVAERLSNRLRAFAYQYDGWCNTLY